MLFLANDQLKPNNALNTCLVNGKIVLCHVFPLNFCEYPSYC